MWDVTLVPIQYGVISEFLLTHPVWDVTATALNHLSRRVKFLLTHPVWDVTACSLVIAAPNVFLLTHPVWDVT